MNKIYRSLMMKNKMYKNILLLSNIRMNKEKLIIDKYIVIDKIGNGAFGDVYKAIRNTDNRSVAMKIEKKKNTIQRLNAEYDTYVKLVSRGCSIGIPKIYEMLQTDDYNILIMELLGESLEDLFNKYDKKFSISSVLFIGLQIIELIEKFHLAGFLHRDIKPSNFLIGTQNR